MKEIIFSVEDNGKQTPLDIVREFSRRYFAEPRESEVFVRDSPDDTEVLLFKYEDGNRTYALYHRAGRLIDLSLPAWVIWVEKEGSAE